jgi:putative protein kinase ArgK-like GTPase of G3E family
MPKNVVTHFQYDERRAPYVASIAIDPSTPADLLEQNGSLLDVAIRFSHVPSAPPDFMMSMAAAVSVSEYVTGAASTIKFVDPSDLIDEHAGRNRPTRIITIAEVAVFANPDWQDPVK